MQQVEKNYVVPVRSEKLVDNALKGMLTRLDPHSDYMDEREYQRAGGDDERAQFGGVGIEISVEDGVPQVISAIEGTPAAAAGVEPGDRIVKANGEPIIGMDIERGRAPAARQPRNPGRADDRARQPAVLRRADHARRHPRRFGQVGAEARPYRLYPHHDLQREHAGGAARRAGAAASAGRRPAGRVSCSICATMPAGCSTPAVEVAARFSRFRDDRLDARAPTPTRTGCSRPRRTAIWSAACRWSC